MRLMGHESPITKAAWEFAMADPENCDKEWAAYLALVNVKESASASSPTNSSSPLHHHTPAAAVTAPSTTRSTTSPRVLSSAVSTDDFTVDDLSPAARRLLDVLGGGSSSPTPAAVPSSSTATAPTTPAASRVFLGTKHDHTPEAQPVYDYLIGNSTATASPRAPSSANSTVGVPGLAAATAPAEKDLRSVTTTRVESASSDITKDNFSPEISTVLRDPAMLNATSIAVASSAPTTCSAECPSQDASVYAAALIPSATSKSSATTGAVVPELAVSEVTDKATDMDVHCCFEPELTATFSTLTCALVASSVSTPTSPTTVSTAFVSSVVGDLFEGGNSLTLQPPWPPPRYATSQEENMCKEMPQVLLWQLFVFESTQLMRWAAENSWPPPFPSICTVFWFASGSILNLHSTLDNLQLSRDCQVMKTMTLGYSVVLLVIKCVPEVPSIQLQPTLFKWPVSFCYDTHLPIPSTSVESLLDLLFTRWPMCIFWTWCYLDDLHWSPGSTSFAIPDWKMLITVNCDLARVHFRWAIIVQQSTSSVLFLASLDGRAEIYHHLQGNYHCPDLMHWSFSQSLMVPEDLFYTPGYILVCCCALMQWKIPWITRLVSWKSYFGCCRAEQEPLYSYGYFQWTNSHSCPWLFNCLLLVKVLELKPWPSWGLLLCSYVVNKNLDISRESLHSFGNVQWTISCCSFSVLDGCSAVPIFVWLELEIKSSQGSHVEFNASNRNGKLHDLVEMVEPKLWSPALISCLCGAPCVLINSVLTLKCIYSKSSSYLEVPICNAICIMFSTSKKLHAGESYWLLDLYSSCDLLVSEYAAHFGSQTLEWKNPWCFCPCHAVSSSNKLEMQLVGGHSKISVAFSFCWAMSSTIHIVIYLPGACIIQWGSEMMSWENASSNDGIFSCVNRVLITSWDPGGLYPILVASWNITHLQFKHLTWDPGGSTWNIGLRASRSLRRGDCQRPPFTRYWAGWVGRQLGPWPAWEPGASAYIWTELPHWDGGFLEQKEGRLRPRPGEAGEVCRVCGVCAWFSSSSFDPLASSP